MDCVKNIAFGQMIPQQSYVFLFDNGVTLLLHLKIYNNMPTIKKRLNLSLPESIDNALTNIASRDGVPTATKALELLTFALEIEEDIVLEGLALVRDEKTNKYVSHEDAWGV